MAERKPVRVDGETVYAPANARLIDVVPSEVQSVITQEGALIPRKAFARVPVPDGFETNLTAINKGTGRQSV